MDNINKEIGRRIKDKRQNMGLSQDDLARELNYRGQASVSKLERGEQEFTVNALIQIAGILKTTPVHLMVGSGVETTNNKGLKLTENIMGWFNSKNKNPSSLEDIGIPKSIAQKIRNKQASKLTEDELQLAFNALKANRNLYKESYEDVKKMNEILTS